MNNKTEQKLMQIIQGKNINNLLIAGQDLLISILVTHLFLKIIFIFLGIWYVLIYIGTMQKAKTVVEIINMSTANLPPELQEKLKEVDGLMKQHLNTQEGVCKNPHCSECWGLADGDEKQI